MDFKGRVEALLAKDSYDVYDLAEVVSLLRCENGCPWDKVQTHESLRKDLLEETYEALDAIDQASPEMLREELGDVLLQVVFHADIEKDEGRYTLDDIADEVCKKLILRHPHVFGEVQADTVDKVLSNWDAIKKQEKHQQSDSDTLRSVPKNFPALMRAQKLGKRAARAGVDFADAEQAKRALREMLESGADFGEMMFVCANAARKLELDAEECLAKSCEGFIKRFELLEAQGRLTSESVAELYDLDNN